LLIDALQQRKIDAVDLGDRLGVPLIGMPDECVLGAERRRSVGRRRQPLNRVGDPAHEGFDLVFRHKFGL